MNDKINNFLITDEKNTNEVFNDSFTLDSRNVNNERIVNTDVTNGDILDYITETTINTPLPALDIGELGRVLVIKKVDAAPLIEEVQIITDSQTNLLDNNLKLAFKYGLDVVYYLEQVELDLSLETMKDYFSIVLVGFTIDPATFSTGLANVVYVPALVIEENSLASNSKVFLEYDPLNNGVMGLIHATLYARNMLASNYKDIQYEEITDPIACPVNIGEAKLLRSYNINFVYNDKRYGRRIALSRCGGMSGYKPYLQYKIVKELKYNNFTFATSQKPYDNKTLKTILEQKQINYIVDNYSDVLNIETSNFVITNKNVGFQTWECIVDFELYESVWFFNLIVNIA